MLGLNYVYCVSQFCAAQLFKLQVNHVKVKLPKAEKSQLKYVWLYPEKQNYGRTFFWKYIFNIMSEFLHFVHDFDHLAYLISM